MSRAFRHVEATADLAECHRPCILAKQCNEVEAALDQGFDKSHDTTLSKFLERHSISISRDISQIQRHSSRLAKQHRESL